MGTLRYWVKNSYLLIVSYLNTSVLKIQVNNVRYGYDTILVT